MNDFNNFSSFPHDQEMGFVVYEQRMAEAQQKSFTAAIVAAVAVFVLAIGIYLGVSYDDTDITKDMNMSNLTRAPGATGSDTPAAAAPAPAATGSDSGSAAAPAASGSAASGSAASGSAAEAGSGSGS